MMSSEQARAPDPYGAFLFSVEVSSGTLARAGEVTTVVGFSEVSGLAFETEVESLKVGGVNFGDVLLPGPGKSPSRLVFKRGLADKSYFWGWYLGVMEGRIVRRAITVSIKDSTGAACQFWSFQEACPVKWTGPDLRAANSAVGFESIELIHKGLQRSG